MENKVSDSQVAKQISKQNIRIWNYIVTAIVDIVFMI